MNKAIKRGYIDGLKDIGKKDLAAWESPEGPGIAVLLSDGRIFFWRSEEGWSLTSEDNDIWSTLEDSNWESLPDIQTKKLIKQLNEAGYDVR